MGHRDRGKGWSLHSVSTYSYDQGHNSRCRRGIGMAGVWHRCGIGVANCMLRILQKDTWLGCLTWIFGLNTLLGYRPGLDSW